MVKTGIITVGRKFRFPLVAEWRQQTEIVRRAAAASTDPKVGFRHIFRQRFSVQRGVDPMQTVFSTGFCRNFCGSQRNRAVTAILDRVVANDGNVVRHLDAVLGKRRTYADRHTIIGTGDCFRKFLTFQKHLFYHLVTTRVPIISMIDIFLQNRKTMRFHALFIATQTLDRVNMRFASI